MKQRYCPTCFSRFEGEQDRCPNDGAKLILLSEQDLVGLVLDDRYRILRLIGKGGMGSVYEAEQAMIGRRVALKVLRGAMVQDESGVKRFLTEARAIATLKSPHTITLHDFGVTQEGMLYYTMELLEGQPLSRLIRAQAPIGYHRASGLLLQACKSLAEAHDKGILHRDLKPDNLFITDTSDGEHVTILDFGIAKLADSNMDTITKTGMICGTPAYLSPEQAQGYPAVAASDLYSLGIVFYEMLAGKPPFSDTTAMRILMQHISAAPKPLAVVNPQVLVPASIEQFLMRALSKSPEERFPSVKDFASSLEAALDQVEDDGDTVALPSLATSAAGIRSVVGDDTVSADSGGTTLTQTPADLFPGLAGPALIGQGEADTLPGQSSPVVTGLGLHSRELGKWLLIGAGGIILVILTVLLISSVRKVEKEEVRPTAAAQTEQLEEKTETPEDSRSVGSPVSGPRGGSDILSSPSAASVSGLQPAASKPEATGAEVPKPEAKTEVVPAVVLPGIGYQPPKPENLLRIESAGEPVTPEMAADLERFVEESAEPAPTVERAGPAPGQLMEAVNQPNVVLPEYEAVNAPGGALLPPVEDGSDSALQDRKKDQEQPLVPEPGKTGSRHGRKKSKGKEKKSDSEKPSPKKTPEDTDKALKELLGQTSGAGKVKAAKKVERVTGTRPEAGAEKAEPGPALGYRPTSVEVDPSKSGDSAESLGYRPVNTERK